MSELVSVKDDENDHVGGALHASTNSGKFYINGKLLVTVESTADPDLLHPLPPTTSQTGSEKFFVVGLAVHRNNDLRYCGAKTIASGQTKFYSG